MTAVTFRCAAVPVRQTRQLLRDEGARVTHAVRNAWISSPTWRRPRLGLLTILPTATYCQRRAVLRCIQVDDESRGGGLFQRNDNALRGTLHFDAAPGRWAVRDGVRTAKGLIDPDGAEMGGLTARHVDGGQKEPETFAACIDSLDQGDRN